MNSEKIQKVIDEIKEYNLYSCDDRFNINDKEIIFLTVTHEQDYFNEYVEDLFQNGSKKAKEQYLNTFKNLFIMIIDNTLFLLPKNDYYSKLDMCIFLS